MAQPQSTPPSRYQHVAAQYPEIVAAYEALGAACHGTGPLPPTTRELVKLGLAIGAGLESAVHAHTRLAREAGASPEEIRHAALLSATTLGFPTMMRALVWVDDVLTKGR